MQKRVWTAAELRDRRKQSMPGRLGELHHELGQELSRTRLRWSELMALFDEEGVKTLRATAPGFFGRLRQMYWEAVLMQLARMIDSPMSVGRKNLTVRCLSAEIPEAEADLREVVMKLIDQAVTATLFARDYRNRRLAHRDLEWTFTPETQPLETATKERVESALDALAAVLNAIELRFENSSTSYRTVIMGAGGTGELLYYLSLGLAAEESKRRERACCQSSQTEPADPATSAALESR